jgi:DNA-binding CsgD family transcriptional regulator
VALFVALMLWDYPPVLIGIFDGSAELASAFVLGSLLALVPTGLACALHSLGGHAPIVAQVLLAIGIAGTWVAPGAAISPVVGAMLGACAGVGIALLVAVMGSVPDRRGGVRAILSRAGICLGVASLLEWACLLIARPLGPHLFQIAALGAIALSLVLGLLVPHGGPKPGAEPDRAAVGIEQVRPILTQAWVLACGLALPLMIVGLTWGDVVSQTYLAAQDATPLERPFFTALACFVCVAYLRRGRCERPSVAFQVLSLLASALLLVSWFVPSSQNFAGMTLMSMTRGIAFPVFILGLWLYLRLGTVSRPRLASALFGIAASLYGGVMLACMLLSTVAPPAGVAMVTPCLTVAYLLVVAVSGIVEGTRQQPTAYRADLDESCGDVARRYLLSPREAEVLRYLARGRTADYIADELGISPYTVKTHVKRIHEKLAVSSKEEIIELVEAQGRGGSSHCSGQDHG